MSLARIVTVVSALMLRSAAALAHGGHPHDEVTANQLIGVDAPAIAPPGTPGEKNRVVGEVVATDTLGEGAARDSEQDWATQHALGMGYLGIPDDELHGIRLAPGSHHLLLTVDTVASTNPAARAYDSFAVTLLARDGEDFDWGVGQVGLRDSDLVGARTTALTIGFARYHDEFSVGGMRLEVRAHIVANLVQETVSDSPLLRGIEDGLRACSTQSEIGLDLRLHLNEHLAIAVFGIDQDDPFHFTSGAECFGDGAVWSQSSKVGGTVDVQLGGGFVLSAGLTWATAAVGYDLEVHRHGVAIGGEYRNTNVEAMVSVAWHE